MTDITMDRTPSMKAAAVEQLRVVGLAVRREALAICAGLALLLLLVPFVEEIVVEVGPILNPTDLGVIAAFLGLASPLAVWKGETLFGESRLWTLPVDHARHARMKVAAGWVWLMGVVSVGVLSLVLFVVLVGGDAGSEGTRWMVTDLDAVRSGAGGGVRQMVWTTPLWHWAHPFVVATWGYVAVSALLLGFKRPYHWAVGGWLAFLAFGLLGEEGNIARVTSTLDVFMGAIDWLVFAGSDYSQVTVTLESGQRVRAWTRIPTLGSVVVAQGLWMGLACVSLWAASARSRES
jgi:hypothetical protein